MHRLQIGLNSQRILLCFILPPGVSPQEIGRCHVAVFIIHVHKKCSTSSVWLIFI